MLPPWSHPEGPRGLVECFCIIKHCARGEKRKGERETSMCVCEREREREGGGSHTKYVILYDTTHTPHHSLHPMFVTQTFQSPRGWLNAFAY